MQVIIRQLLVRPMKLHLLFLTQNSEKMMWVGSYIIVIQMHRRVYELYKPESLMLWCMSAVRTLLRA